MSRLRTRSEEGFTLVEIMVALAIMAIIAAIAIPLFIKQREKAYYASLRADVTSTGMAVSAWASSHSWDELIAIGTAEGLTLTNSISAQRWDFLANKTKNVNGKQVPKYGLPLINPDTDASLSIGFKIDDEKISTNGWTHSPGQGNFCVVGNHADSEYNYPGGDQKRYDEQLYWDQEAGPGTFIMEELVQVRNSTGNGAKEQAKRPLSCSGWVNYYKMATGK